MNLNAVETKITVDGKPCDFIHMDLDQRMAGHHVFEISVSYRHEKQSVWALTVDDIFRETLYKPVNIQMKHIETGEVNEFNGVVTDIEAVGVDGDKGTIILRGGSPTILLDRDPAMGAFVDYTLYNVVAETLENTGIKVELENNPALQRAIPYIARYKESSFAFLSRILYSFGEWFYYDGKKLIVGNPMNQNERRVTYDMELQEVRSVAGLRNLNTKYYDYDPTENNYFEEDSTTISNANLVMKGAQQVAEPLYPTAAKLPVGRAVLGETDMSNIVRVKQSREYTKTSIFTARCKTCGVRVGEIATAFVPEFPDVRIKDLGSFRVLEVRHSVNKEGHYENTFKGITAQTETLPDDHIVMPQAFQEPATVVDNNDPRGQGRVKVRYFWQGQDESTNWIRVQTPDAGCSDVVAKNRGFVFIPEVDDQVMVGFQYGDPSRPYVMGSLFHRDNSKGAAADNNIKTISTKSGHLIEFNDDEGGDLGITVKDRNNNIIHIKTGSDSIDIEANKDVTVVAGETMTLKSKNLVIEVDENMTTTVGGDQKTTVGGTVEDSSNELKETISQDATITVKNKMIQTLGNADIIAKDGDIVVKAAGKALIQGAKDARISKG